MSADHPGVLLCMAGELKSPQDTIPALTPEEAGELALLIAQDLHEFEPRSAQLELLTVGALYDPVEILRPMWPVHLELQNLAARAPRKPAVAKGDEVLAGEGRLIAFGEGDSKLPGALTPDPQFTGGPLRLLPLVLQGEPSVAISCADHFERLMLETGMAGAGTALFVEQKFSLRIEHVRYLTAFDLAAMMHLQYRHAGIDVVWPVIEAALMGRADPIRIDRSPEPFVVYEGGSVAITVREDAGVTPAMMAARMAQMRDLLTAHGLRVTV